MSLPPSSRKLNLLMKCFPDSPFKKHLAKEIKAYGQQCREAALEEAAQAIEQASRARTDGTGYHFDAAAEIIEALK